MNRSVLSIPALIAACTTTPQTLDLDLDEGRPVSEMVSNLPRDQLGPTDLLLLASETVLNPGDRLELRVAGNLTPGDTVYLAGAPLANGGPCLPVLGGDCLAIGPAPRLLSQRTVPNQGLTTFVLTVPANVPAGARYAMQAVVPRGSSSSLSNPRVLTIFDGANASTCATLKASDPSLPSGLYSVSPDGVLANDIWCDMEADGGGWTLVGSSSSAPLKDEAADWYADLGRRTPTGANRGIWTSLRTLVAAAGSRSDMRFVCRAGGGIAVDLSFYETDWYREITVGNDGQSCFATSADSWRPGPARRNNLTGETRQRGNAFNTGYLLGEDTCRDPFDFAVDFDDGGVRGDRNDGTDWGEADGTPPCGLATGSAWQLYVREVRGPYDTAVVADTGARGRDTYVFDTWQDTYVFDTVFNDTYDTELRDSAVDTGLMGTSTTIPAIRTGSGGFGYADRLAVRGVVSAIGPQGFTLRHPPAAANGGIYLFTNGLGHGALAPGDIVDAVGDYLEYDDNGFAVDRLQTWSQLIVITRGTGFTPSGHITPLPPQAIAPATMATPATIEPYESMLVRIVDPSGPLTVTRIDAEGFEVRAGSHTFLVTRDFYDLPADATSFPGFDLGSQIGALSGVVVFTQDQHRLAVRSASDAAGFLP